MRITLFGLILLFLLPATLCAATVQLAETGQSTCYDTAGVVIPCAATGQDGEIQAGAAWPDPRFVDNTDGTVTDNLTGLIWLKNANCAATLGGVAKTTTLTWANAITWSNALATGSCGLNDGSAAGDWRLPNVTELESLVNAAQANSAAWLNLPAQGFNNVQSGRYWSSSTRAVGTGYAWYVYMLLGNVDYLNKTFSYYVWPVRGGQ